MPASRLRWRAMLGLVGVAMLVACERDGPNSASVAHPEIPSPASGSRPGQQSRSPFAGSPFADVARERGIDYRHYSGFGGHRYIVEIVSGGGGFVDFDGDGDLDIYFVDGAPVGDDAATRSFGNRLFANDGGGHFHDVTERAGVGDLAFGLGLAVGDVDEDGDADIYVTNLGPNTLFRNRGDGTFERVADAGGAAGAELSSSCTLFDFDRDGDLDLYVANYVAFSPDRHVPCFLGGEEIYCSPAAFDGVPDRFYRNDGSGHFRDDTSAVGLAVEDPGRAGKGLGVVAGDFDGDGGEDLYVANDGTPNALLIQREGRLVDEALYAGAALGETGRAEAGMGCEFGDVDGDLDLDIVCTNLEAQTNSIYINEGGLQVLESSYARGFGPTTLPHVGFGVRLFDRDLDGDLDVYIANGHIIDNIERLQQGKSFAQPDLLFDNDGSGHFAPTPGFETAAIPRRVGRAVATADIDDDGDLDLLVCNNDQPPLLLLNRGPCGPAVGLRLVGTPPSNRDAIGAVVRADVGGKTLLREVRAQSSYLASSDPRLLIGVAKDTTRVTLSIRWPSGRVESVTGVPAGAYHRVVEGRGVVDSTPFHR